MVGDEATSSGSIIMGFNLAGTISHELENSKSVGCMTQNFWFIFKLTIPIYAKVIQYGRETDKIKVQISCDYSISAQIPSFKKKNFQ